MRYRAKAEKLLAEAAQRFAWPGGYPLHAVLGDGEPLCCACCEKERASILDAEFDRQWRIEGVQVHWEGEPLQCSHCNADIESAYGVPD